MQNSLTESCQDRLGTNIGKAPKKRTTIFRDVAHQPEEGVEH
eukprot:COSAG06_NODE_71832_length_179_cov_15.587500_1_plen_41_part_10